MELRRAGIPADWDAAADAIAGNLTPLLAIEVSAAAMREESSADASAMERFLLGLGKGTDRGEFEDGRGYGAIILSFSSILGGGW